MSPSPLIRFGTFNPERNLREHHGRRESCFVGRFVRTFLSKQRQKAGLGCRHLAVEGYGIADFVWLNMKKPRRPELYAFEMKLRNWREALLQAYRYSYFADAAIVVLPRPVAFKAQAHIDLFESMGIGLWAFDQEAERIQTLHRGKDHGARNALARDKALVLFRRNSKFRQLFE